MSPTLDDGLMPLAHQYDQFFRSVFENDSDQYLILTKLCKKVGKHQRFSHSNEEPVDIGRMKYSKANRRGKTEYTTVMLSNLPFKTSFVKREN